VVVAGAWIVVESFNSSFPQAPVVETPAVYPWLAGREERVLLELPDYLSGEDWEREADYQFFSTSHWMRLVNGYSRFRPPDYDQYMVPLQSFPDPVSFSFLRDLGVDLVVVHGDRFDPAEWAARREALIESPVVEVLAELPPDDLVLRVADYDRIPFGLYPSEEWEGEFPFRWTKAEAQLVLRVQGRRFLLPMRNAHPRVEAARPRVNVSVAGLPSRTIVFEESAWRGYTFDLPAASPEVIAVRLRTSPTWSPADFGHPTDARELGVAIGEVVWLPE